MDAALPQRALVGWLRGLPGLLLVWASCAACQPLTSVGPTDLAKAIDDAMLGSRMFMSGAMDNLERHLAGRRGHQEALECYRREISPIASEAMTQIWVDSIPVDRLRQGVRLASHPVIERVQPLIWQHLQALREEALARNRYVGSYLFFAADRFVDDPADRAALRKFAEWAEEHAPQTRMAMARKAPGLLAANVQALRKCNVE